jgi:hypothetical protein
MSDETPTTGHPEGLTRTGVHRVLESELGANWRKWRWWARQFTPTSLSALGVVIAAAGGWIVNQAHKIDNQGTRIVVLETQIVPDLKLAGRVGNIERDVARLQGAVGQFDYPTAKQELEKPLMLRGQPLQPAKLTPPVKRR